VSHHVIEDLDRDEEVASLQAEVTISYLDLMTHELLILLVGGSIDIRVTISDELIDGFFCVNVVVAETNLRHFESTPDHSRFRSSSRQDQV